MDTVLVPSNLHPPLRVLPLLLYNSCAEQNLTFQYRCFDLSHHPNLLIVTEYQVTPIRLYGDPDLLSFRNHCNIFISYTITTHDLSLFRHLFVGITILYILISLCIIPNTSLRNRALSFLVVTVVTGCGSYIVKIQFIAVLLSSSGGLVLHFLSPTSIENDVFFSYAALGGPGAQKSLKREDRGGRKMVGFRCD